MAQQAVFLYIEDDTLSREIMALMLQGLGYTQFTMFESSEHFIERIEALAATPTVIFLDIHMTPHNGFEILEACASIQYSTP